MCLNVTVTRVSVGSYLFLDVATVVLEYPTVDLRSCNNFGDAVVDLC